MVSAVASNNNYVVDSGFCVNTAVDESSQPIVMSLDNHHMATSIVFIMIRKFYLP